ncbi:MAG: hypothetical protein IKD42_02755 [Kiritimatiellae bacterium]|nr:hypothetical protein [Kiritimatiellia bacterium]
MSKAVKESAAVSAEAKSGVLVGRFDHALDPKKRLTIPSEWRAVMGCPEYVYAMPDRKDRCVNIVSMSEMDVILGRLREKALFNPALGKACQTIGENSELLALDSQGRIRVCDRFLKFAGLSGTVAMVGAVRMIKLWNPASLAPEDDVDQTALDKALEEAGF